MSSAEYIHQTWYEWIFDPLIRLSEQECKDEHMNIAVTLRCDLLVLFDEL